MKQFDKKDVFSWSNAEKAKEYVGKLGYFGDSLEDIKKWVQNYPPDFLFQILGKDEKKRFMVDDPEVYIFKLFLPAIKVIEAGEPKKWRAFKDLNDFKTYAKKSVGSVLVYRKKNKNHTMKTSMITNYVFDTKCISLGNLPFSFETLFDEYEWLNEHGIWQPFGVLGDENKI